DAVTEDQEEAVVVGAAGEPAHEPAATLVAAELPLDGVRVGGAVVPKRAIDYAHQVGILGAAAAGLVRREQNLGAEQRGGADILDEVAVVADQDAGAPTV